MKKRKHLILLCAVVLSAVVLVCAICIPLAVSGGSGNQSTEPQASTEQATTRQTAKVVESTEYQSEIDIAAGNAYVIDLSDEDTEKLESFESSAADVVSVDSGGRIDALKQGSALVTAKLSDGRQLVYEIVVSEAEQESVYDGFSTCITANTEVVERNTAFSDSSKNLFKLMVNKTKNCVTAYTYDLDGEYTVPVRAMICSCGLDDATITGDFDLYFHQEWNPLYNDVYGYYVSGISGDYLFHSVPFYDSSPDTLETEEFNKLGSDASLGCVRMAVGDAKWVYDNCPIGTEIVIYESENPGPLGIPQSIKITDLSCGWDPTDNDPENPYYSKTPTITGAEDLTIGKNSDFNALDSVSATDTCGNDITDKIECIGNVITSKAGTYKLTYTVTDALHRTASVETTVTVQ